MARKHTRIAATTESRLSLSILQKERNLLNWHRTGALAQCRRSNRRFGILRVVLCRRSFFPGRSEARYIER